MAATVIDALLVTLGLDASNYTQGQKQAAESILQTKKEAEKRAKEIEAAGKQAAAYFTKIRNEALALFAAFTAGRGLAEFVKDTTATNAATGRLAHNLGLSVESLSEWEGAARRVGGSAEATAASLQSLTNQYEELRLTGNSAIVPALRFLGITNADQLKDLPSLLLSIADQFQRMDPRQAMTIGQRMGLDPGTIMLLEQGRVGVEKLLDAQRRMGVITQADVNASIELQNAWLDLEQSSNTLGRRILTDVTPALVDFLHVLTQIAEWFIEHPRIAEAAFAALAAVTLTLSAALTVALARGALTMVASAFGFASTEALGFFSILGVLLGRLNLIALAAVTVYKALHIGGLNIGESQELDRLRNEAHMGPRDRGRPAISGPQSVANQDLSLSQQSFLDVLSAPESNGNYNAFNPRSKAFGRYQFLPSTWQEVAPKAGVDVNDHSSRAQDTVAWYLASEKYKRETNGRNLSEDWAQGGHEADIANALKDLWPSLPGGSQQLETMEEFKRNRELSLSGRHTDLENSNHRSVPDPLPPVPPIGSLDNPENEKHNHPLYQDTQRGRNNPFVPFYLQDHNATSSDNKLSPDTPENTDIYLKGMRARQKHGEHFNNRRLFVDLMKSKGTNFALAAQSHSEIHIGQVAINVPSGDPNTIAKGIQNAIQRYTYVPQANSGLA